jgi:hypothetical protein
MPPILRQIFAPKKPKSHQGYNFGANILISENSGAEQRMNRLSAISSFSSTGDLSFFVENAQGRG